MAEMGVYCCQCGYDLRGQVEHGDRRCPECGRPFDPRNGKTFRLRRRPRWGRWLRRTAIGVLLAAFTLSATWGWLYWGWRDEQKGMAGLKLRYRPFPSFDSTGQYVTLGGMRLHALLGDSAWILLRVRCLTLPPSTTDAELTNLTAFYYLQWLEMGGDVHVTNGGLANLEGLAHLRILVLAWDTRIGDAGLVHLEHLGHLTTLQLQGTAVTDAGLLHLEKLRGLMVLDVRDTAVTLAGITKLRASNPELDVLSLWNPPR